MNTIEETFHTQRAFVAYFCAGDGGNDYSIEAALALEKGGVNILELGVPFSDPVADGFVIQEAAQRSLSGGTNLSDVLAIAQEIRKQSSIPIILFSYYNPLLQGGEAFYKAASQAGVNGILVVDLPPEEAGTHRLYLERYQLSGIFLVTPSTPSQRLEELGNAGAGFIYYVCRKGTTGVKTDLPSDYEEEIIRLKKYISLPIATGFGISTKEQAARALAGKADGFVVGSAFVRAMGEKASSEELCQLAQSLDPR